MPFSELVQLLKFYFGGQANNIGEFLVELVDNFMEKPSTEADKKKAADGVYNPLAELQYETLKDYCNGKRAFPDKHASVIRGKMDKPRFAEYIESFSIDALSALQGDLVKYGINVALGDVGAVCADLFAQAMSKSTDKKMPGKAGMEEYSEELGIFPDGRVALDTVYVKNGLLHIGGEAIKLSDKLTPPEDISEEEQGYVPKLFEAYTDAEPNDVTPDTIAKYPRYKQNLNQQRTNYFNAVYVINTVRSKFGKEWSEQLDYLKQDTYDGIVDVYFGEHEHGYARLNAVLTQAINAPIEKSLLAKIRNLIGNSEKKGICHILASEGTIKSWVEIYDA
jgi:hypothetical protein